MLEPSSSNDCFTRLCLSSQAGRVSGRLIVPLVFGFAIVMAGIVFWVGLQEKRSWDHVSIPGLGQDSLVVTRPDSLQRLMRDWPKEWLQVSRLDERLAIVVPCFSETPKLTLLLDSINLHAQPLWACPFCDAADSLYVMKWVRAPTPAMATSRMEQQEIKLYLKGDSLPWIYRPDGALHADSPMFSLKGPALILPRQGDSLWFFPSDSLSALELVREQDESPEGCQPDENHLEAPAE